MTSRSWIGCIGLLGRTSLSNITPSDRRRISQRCGRSYDVHTWHTKSASGQLTLTHGGRYRQFRLRFMPISPLGEGSPCHESTLWRPRTMGTSIGELWGRQRRDTHSTNRQALPDIPSNTSSSGGPQNGVGQMGRRFAEIANPIKLRAYTGRATTCTITRSLWRRAIDWASANVRVTGRTSQQSNRSRCSKTAE